MGADMHNKNNSKLLLHSWWGDFKLESWIVRPNATIEIRNALNVTSKSVVLTATNGQFR